jgi:hypothetical protein
MDVHLSCACIGSVHRNGWCYFFYLFVVYYSATVLKNLYFLGSKHIGRGANRDGTQRQWHEPRRAIDAARCFLIAEGGRGDGCHVLQRRQVGGREIWLWPSALSTADRQCTSDVLQHHQVCGARGCEIWLWSPALPLLLHSRPTECLGSLLVVSFDVLGGRWGISVSPNPSTNKYSALVVYWNMFLHSLFTDAWMDPECFHLF